MIYVGSNKNCYGNRCIYIDSIQEFDGYVAKQLQPDIKTNELLQEIKKNKIDTATIINFTTSYYNGVLAKINPKDAEDYIYRALPKVTEEPVVNSDEDYILVSSGDSKSLDHRQVVAAWLELLYNKPVREVKTSDSGEIIPIERNRTHYSIIKGTIETLLRRDLNMHGFNSIAAALLYDISLDYDSDRDLIGEFGNYGNAYRSLAEVIEENYNKSNKKK